MGIDPLIRVCKNASIKSNGYMAYKFAVGSSIAMIARNPKR
jgi:hypothetical protein